MNEPKSNPALTKALDLLSRRSYSKAILIDKLREKEFLPEDIRIAIKRLEDLNFIDDRRYAQSLVREYSELKRYGAYRIKLKLKEKKVPEEIIIETIGLIDPQSQEDNLEHLAGVQVRKNRNLSREKLINRTLGFLIRRGYSFDKAKKAINKALEE